MKKKDQKKLIQRSMLYMDLNINALALHLETSKYKLESWRDGRKKMPDDIIDILEANISKSKQVNNKNIIGEYLIQLDINKIELAIQLGVTYATLFNIINSSKPIQNRYLLALDNLVKIYNDED